MADFVRTLVDGSIWHLVLDRPERANALAPSVMDDLVQAVQLAQADDEARVIILSGEGGGFSAGHDMKESAEFMAPDRAFEDYQRLRSGQQRWNDIWQSSVPIIAQVHGYCLAGAVDLLMACDLVIAADDTRFGYPPIRSAAGVPPQFAYPFFLNMRRAKQFLWIQQDMTAREAVEWGLINLAVPVADLAVTARYWAERIAWLPRENVVLQKQAFRKASEIQGFSTIVSLGNELDTIAHRSGAARDWWDRVDALGLSEAIRERDQRYSAPAVVDRSDRPSAHKESA